MDLAKVAGEKINLRLGSFVDLYLRAVRVRIGQEYLVGFFHQRENRFIFLLPPFALEVLYYVHGVQTGNQAKSAYMVLS